MTRLAAVLAVALVAAGCGGGSDEAASTAPALGVTALEIVYLPDGPGGPSVRWELRCDPPGGSLPKAAAACAKLEALDVDPFTPLSTKSACTQQYGGPQTARVSGTFRSRRVDADFSRTDGCQIGRWNRLAFLFRPSGPA